MLFGVLLGSLVKFFSIAGQLLGNFFLERMIGLGILQQAVDREQAVFRREGGSPLSQNSTADFPRPLQNGGMIDHSLKLEHRRLEGVLSGKFQAQDEFTACVGSVGRTLEGDIPDEQIVADEYYTLDILERCLFQFGAFLWKQQRLSE
jgi:hypothetical protein